MNRSWVIDSSIGFAWVLPAQSTDASDLLLDEVAAGINVVVPALWFSEVANSLLVLQRRKKLTSEERREAIECLSKLPLTVDEETARTAFGKTSELADRYGLTVYDATYLELAIRRQLPLATRDEALFKAAKNAGLKTL